MCIKIDSEALKNKLEKALLHNPHDLFYEVAKEAFKYPSIWEFFLLVSDIQREWPSTTKKLFCFDSEKKLNSFYNRYYGDVMIHRIFPDYLPLPPPKDEKDLDVKFRVCFVAFYAVAGFFLLESHKS